MKKNKKVIIGFIAILVVVVVAGIVILRLTKNNNRLNVIEKQWINNNNKMVLNIGVKNDSNVFGSDGVGVFYDFITDFSNEYNLTINPATYTNSKSSSDVYFRETKNLTKNDLLIYQDHYVVVSKKQDIFTKESDLENLNVGVLASDLSYISNYMSHINNLNFIQFKKKDQLLDEFKNQEKIDYIIVPMHKYLDTILEEDNYINYHISDIPLYYTLNTGNNDKTFKSVLEKYYNKWIKDNYENHYDEELFAFLSESLDISEEQIDKLRAKTYNYGFVENNPYEALSGNNYGGIVGVYLDEFKNLSKIDIKYTRFKNKRSLINAINKKDIDLYFNYFNMNSDYNSIKSLLGVNFDIIVPESENKVINSLNSIKNEDIYVLENTLLENYLSSNSSLKVKTYKNERELKRIVKKGYVIAIDSNSYKANKSNILRNYTSRFSDAVEMTYNFNSNASSTFNKLFQNYLIIKDPQITTNEGIYENKLIVKSGTLLGTIASYIIYIIIIGVIIGAVAYKSTKKIKVAKKIKKEDKMRFIDQLTSLKNRNYLSENIEAWNKNTIYPQTTLIIDVSNIQYINDTYGYEEGDKQIKAAANILVKLQLDNTDIIRTDGTEFMIYFVGYSERQIASYMKKLNKEFKKLPYDYGVVMGYSTIKDDLKLIEDAINEATLSVKEKKNEKDTDKNDEKI